MQEERKEVFEGMMDEMQELEIALSSLEEGKDLCEIILRNYDFVNISDAQKLDNYKVIGVLLPFLFDCMCKNLESFKDNFYELWELMFGKGTGKGE